MDLIIWYPL